MHPTAASRNFLLQREDQFLDAPADLIGRLNDLEAKSGIGILTDGVTSRYTLYIDGTKVEYNGDWQLVAQGPGPEDAVVGALRYNWNDSIIAMTTAAKEAIEKREQDIETQRRADAEIKAQQKVHDEAQERLRGDLRERLAGAKFKKQQIGLSYTVQGKPTPMRVEAETYKGIGVHKEPHGSRYSVSHINTGMTMAGGFKTKADAKMAGMRMADAGDLYLLRSRADLTLPELAKMRTIVLAIRSTKYDNGEINPLAQPELDVAQNVAPNTPERSTTLSMG